MKTSVIAYIDKVTKEDGNVTLTLAGKGKADTKNINAQETIFHGTLTLKAVIANQIPLGAAIRISMTDEVIPE